MRELSTTAILALHALHLMMRREAPVTLREIVKSSGFPEVQVLRVLGRLNRGGLIRSRRGRGYVLTQAPGEITLEDIFRAVDHPRAPTAPCGGDFDACDVRASCVLAPLCRKAEQGFQETIRSFTLADLKDHDPQLPLCRDPKLRADAS